MGKLFLISVVCLFASCGPSAEKLKEDAEYKQAVKTGDSLDSVCVTIIKAF